MRTAIFAAAAFAVGAIAVPMEKRANVVVTETAKDIVYVTQYYTVTGGEAAPTKEAAPQKQQHYGHHVQWGNKPGWWGGKPNKGKATTIETTVKATPTTAKATWEPAPTQTHTQAPPQTTQPSSGGGSPSGYAGVVVDQHNIHRSNHSASNIQWSASLAGIAADIARTCVYAHNV